MKIVSAVDIGTNTVLQLIAQTGHQKPNILFDGGEIVRLGQGVDAARTLHPEAVARTLAVLEQFAQRENELRVDKADWVATSAVRDAANRDEFLKQVKDRCGRDIRVISGEEEARLSFRAVELDFGSEKPLVVIDIGGGSTEYILGHQGQILARQSLQLGSVRVTERCIHSDPVSAQDRETLRKEISKQLVQLPPQFLAQARNCRWVGVAGTATTMAALRIGKKEYPRDEVQGYVLKRAELTQLCDMLAALTLAQRQQLAGLQPKRADVIYAGAAILLKSMEFFQVDECTVSDHGLRWALIAE